MSLSITVETSDLRNALVAVTPHADTDPDFPPLHRIRLQLGPHLTNLTVSATNRYTVGHALVSIHDGDGTDGDHVDLSPQDVKEILALFRGKAGDDDQPGDTIRIDVTDATTTITDVSGLFAGKALTLPRYADETNFPDIAALLARTLRAPIEHAERLTTSGKLLGLFGAAARAYSQPLLIEPTGEHAAMVISCGESFLGLLMPMRAADEDTAQQNEWRAAWLRRFDTLAELPA